MDITTISDSKNKAIEFAEGNPHMMLGAIGILIVIIIIMILNTRGYIKTSPAKKKKVENEDEDVDVLIETIHNKQKSE